MAGDDSSKGTEPGQRQPDRADVPQAPLALYRRYRPASFAEVKGQEHVTEPLRQALRSGRVHHAYLFSGPRGCGKTSSARILARSLNCEQGPTPDPCGVCASCVALGPAGPGSIDVIEIDAASHGGIDDARDLRERAFYSPVSARYKIYIIDEAHMVTGAGFNALLKLVEEPPPHLKFVFATTEPEKVIATIRSRTHHYPFRLVPPAILRELLEEILAAERVTYEPAVLPVVIRAGAGSVRDSLSVLDQLIAGADEAGLRYDRAITLLGYTDDALLDEMAQALGRGDGAAVFQAIDHVVEAGHDPRRFAMDLLDRLRDLIVLSAVPEAGKSGLIEASEDQVDRMREQAAEFGQERLARAADTISAGLVEMRGATSPRLLLELMCAQVLLPAGQPAAAQVTGAARVGGPSEIGDLAARLDRIERRLAGQLPGPGAGQARRPAEPRETAAPGPATPAPAARQPAARRPAAPQPAAAGDEAPAGSAAPAGSTRGGMAAGGAQDGGHGTALDTGTLTSRWAEVLDAVREIRKTAWILLSNYATVDAVEGTVLTMSFDTEGNAKGFASSGSDSYLADVLHDMFGVRPVIRAVVRPAAGRGPARGGAGDEPRGGARSGPGHAGGGRPDGPGGDRPDGPGGDRQGSPGGDRPDGPGGDRQGSPGGDRQGSPGGDRQGSPGGQSGRGRDAAGGSTGRASRPAAAGSDASGGEAGGGEAARSDAARSDAARSEAARSEAGGAAAGAGGGRAGEDQRDRAPAGAGPAGLQAEGASGPGRNPGGGTATAPRGPVSGGRGSATADDGESGPSVPGSGASGGGGPGSAMPRSGADNPRGSRSGGSRSDDPVSGRAQPGAQAPGSERPRRTGTGPLTSGRPVSGRPGTGQGPAGADDPRPFTDATPAGSADLTGSDLIMRELGGRLIEEITEA